jgi:hypothetical protein
MEKIEQTSIIDTTLLENLSLADRSFMRSTVFDKKFSRNSDSIKHVLKLVSNCISLREDQGVKFYFYSVKVEGFFQTELTHSILRALRFNGKLRERFNEEFSFSEFSGMGLYVIPKTQIRDTIILYIIFKANRTELIEEEVYTANLEKDEFKEFLFKITLTNKADVVTTHRDFREQLLNIYFKRLLRDNYYSKSNTNIFFKLRPNDKKQFIPEDSYKVSDSKFFVKGYKITSFINEKNVPILRLHTRYRLIHNKTFWQVWHEMGKNENRFSDFCTKTKGMKVYGNEEIRKIDYVRYAKPSEITFMHKKLGTMSLLRYMIDFYGMNLDDEYTPILVKKNKQRTKEKIEGRWVKKEVEVELFYLSKFIYVAGNLPETEKVNMNQFIPASPNFLYDSTLKIIKDLQSSQELNNKFHISSNFLPLNVEGYVLKKPVLEFSNGQDMQPNEEGKIDTVSKCPKDAPPKLEYIVVYNKDIFPEDMDKLILRLHEESKIIMGGILDYAPKVKIYLNFSVRNFDENLAYRELNEKVIIPLKKLDEFEKQNKTKSTLFVLFILPDIHEAYYRVIKNVINLEGIKRESQIISLKKCLNKNTSVYTNIFFQILAKFCYAPWRFKPINKDIQTKTLIITYSVGIGVISFSYSLNSDFTKNYFIQANHDVKSKYLCQDVGKYFEQALKEFALRLKEPRPIENIIIYRDGLNASQLRHFEDWELSSIKEKLAKIKKSTNEKLRIYENAAICCLIVNPDNENRLFLEKPIEGLERGDRKVDIDTNPVGLLIDSSIIIKDRNEFYLVSAYSGKTCSPTRYLILCDETKLDYEFIYNLTLALTFLYYNNNKSIKVPAPLHLCLRRNAQYRLLGNVWASQTPSISY